jgi:hypothetical protein
MHTLPAMSDIPFHGLWTLLSSSMDLYFPDHMTGCPVSDTARNLQAPRLI